MPLTPTTIKYYSALISQSNTDAPTVKILKNDIGNIVWTRLDTGQYFGTLNNAFTEDKTYLTISAGGFLNALYSFELYRNDENQLELDTFDTSNQPSDGLLLDNAIEIRIYH